LRLIVQAPTPQTPSVSPAHEARLASESQTLNEGRVLKSQDYFKKKEFKENLQTLILDSLSEIDEDKEIVNYIGTESPIPKPLPSLAYYYNKR